MALGLKESHLRKGFIIFILLSVAVMVGILVWTTDAETWQQLHQFRLWFIPILIVLAILRWYFDGLFFVTLAKHGHKSSLSLNRAAVIRLEGTVLAAVVPILVGTFTMHAYLLHKEKLKLSESMAMTTLRAILPVFLFLLNIPILFLLKDEPDSARFFTQLIKVLSLPIVVILSFFVITLFFPDRIKAGATHLIHWLGRIKLKHSEEKLLDLEQRVFHEIDQFSKIFWMYLRERKWIMVWAVCCILIAFLIDYLLALCILWGFGYHPPFFRAMAMQFLIRPIIYFAITPGGAGVWEFSYLGFFSLFMPHSLIGISVLIWRLLLTYLPIIIGSLFTAREFTTDENFRKIVEEQAELPQDEESETE